MYVEIKDYLTMCYRIFSKKLLPCIWQRLFIFAATFTSYASFADIDKEIFEEKSDELSAAGWAIEKETVKVSDSVAERYNKAPTSKVYVFSSEQQTLVKASQQYIKDYRKTLLYFRNIANQLPDKKDCIENVMKAEKDLNRIAQEYQVFAQLDVEGEQKLEGVLSLSGAFAEPLGTMSKHNAAIYSKCYPSPDISEIQKKIDKLKK